MDLKSNIKKILHFQSKIDKLKYYRQVDSELSKDLLKESPDTGRLKKREYINGQGG
jgi:hypothetical protein